MTRSIVRRSSLALPLASILAAGCGALEPAPVDEQGSAQNTTLAGKRSALVREAELGIARVSHADGTYSYQLPQGVDTPARRQAGGLLWRYDGQARFEEKPTRAEAQLVPARPSPRPTFERDPVGYFAGTVSVDQYGRRWVVEGVDPKAVAERTARYDALVEQSVGHEPVAAASAKPAPEPAAGASVLWKPLTWYNSDCNGDGNNDLFRYDADDRQVVANPMNDRQKKVLLLSSPAGSCSATMVDTEWLLTAAHCVTNGSGSPYAASNIDACTLGNYQAGAQCFGADIVTVAGGWGGSGMDDDYAVVHLTGLPGVGWMAISQASDSTISGDPGRNIGYPGRKPNCSSNSTAAVHGGYPALIGYWSDGDVTSLSSSRIKTNIDLSGGHSGGPFFYCPSGCTAGAAHYLTGVVSGHETISAAGIIIDQYNGGAKGPAIRTWVINNTP